MSWGSPDGRLLLVDSTPFMGEITAFNKAAWIGPGGARSSVMPGFNPAVGNTAETVWEGGGIRPYPSGPLTMTIVSDAGATDDGAQVRVQYLSTDYSLVPPATVTLNNASPPTIANVLRVLRTDVVGSVQPTGIITVENGGTTYEYMSPTDNQSLSAIWTVPANFLGSLVTVRVNVPDKTDLDYRVVTREQGGLWQSQPVLIGLPPGVSTIIDVPPHHAWAGVRLSAGEDVEVRANKTEATGTDQAASAIINLVNMPNPFVAT